MTSRRFLTGIANPRRKTLRDLQGRICSLLAAPGEACRPIDIKPVAPLGKEAYPRGGQYPRRKQWGEIPPLFPTWIANPCRKTMMSTRGEDPLWAQNGSSPPVDINVFRLGLAIRVGKNGGNSPHCFRRGYRPPLDKPPPPIVSDPDCKSESETPPGFAGSDLQPPGGSWRRICLVTICDQDCQSASENPPGFAGSDLQPPGGSRRSLSPH